MLSFLQHCRTHGRRLLENALRQEAERMAEQRRQSDKAARRRARRTWWRRRTHGPLAEGRQAPGPKPVNPLSRQGDHHEFERRRPNRSSPYLIKPGGPKRANREDTRSRSPLDGTPSIPSGPVPGRNLRRRRRLPPVRNGERLARARAKCRRQQWRAALNKWGSSSSKEVEAARGLDPAAPAWIPAGASTLNPYAPEWKPGPSTGPEAPEHLQQQRQRPSQPSAVGGRGPQRAGGHEEDTRLRPRECTAGEEAQLGLSLRAGPGGCNGCSDPRRFPPTFCRGNYTVALVNPTSVNKHIGAIKSLPADIVALAETALTEGGQKQAAIELAAGDRGLRSVWGPPRRKERSPAGGASPPGTQCLGGWAPLRASP